jgi:hypothetical protein
MPWEPHSSGCGYIYRMEVDWCSELGARQQADELRDYWKRRGIDVETTLLCSGRAHNPVWGFRSNLKPFQVKGNGRA